MTSLPILPQLRADADRRVIVLEAEPGQKRRALLEGWARTAPVDGGSAAWLLPCDPERGGVWAGVNSWAEAVLPDLNARFPELVARHDYELVSVLPILRRRMTPGHLTLTDDTVGEEAVRNYARDRAFRICHGMIDLLREWRSRAGGGCWALVCDDFDRRSALVGYFFRHLVRRIGDKPGLVLVLAVAPGEADRTAAEFAPFARVQRVRVELEPESAERMDPDEAARRAAELEERVGEDAPAVLTYLHELIRLWTAAGREDRVVTWHASALGLLNHRGFYQDALRHAAPVLAGLSHFDRDSSVHTRFKVLHSLQAAYVINDLAAAADELLRTEGIEKLTDPYEKSHVFYMLAMVHARFLPERDLDAADRYLQRGLEELERAELEPERKHFLTGFLLNGLAYVRLRQGDAATAAELTHANFRRLEENLPLDRHRLHRSVLLYNAGQVYAQTGAHDDAIRCFSAAMEMDPNYSEYYNDRGSVYLKMGRLEDAERDYLAAIELSPPYPEVWFNLGQCYTRMGRAGEAARAYARAVDLDPGRHKAWVKLAQARLSLGLRKEALAAYDAAISVDPTNALVLANRAALRFELGRVEDSLADLDYAVTLAPDNAALQRNRAIALDALGRRGTVAAPV